MGKKLTIKRDNTIAVRRPDLLEEWDWEKNSELGLDPYKVAYGSSKKVWWVCPLGHSYDMTPNNRSGVKTKGCPFCSGRRVLAGFNDLATVCPDFAKEWDYERNEKTPEEYTKSSSASVWWVCQTYKHSYQSRICNRTGLGQGCSICAGKIILPGFNDLATTNPECLDDWDYDSNDISPAEVSHGSSRKVWWICHNGHEAYLQAVSHHANGRRCPKCKIDTIREKNSSSALTRTRVDGYKVVATNSLARMYPKLAEEWHPTKNGNLTPFDVAGQSHRSVWWLGKCSHEWEAIIKNRVRESAGCPICSKWLHTSFPEQAIYFYVRELFPDSINNDKPPIDGIGRFTFDVYIPSIKTAVEYDGQTWHSSDLAQKRDAKKDLTCEKLGITLIRIREPKCPQYDGCSAKIIVRDHPTSFESLDSAALSLLAMLGAGGSPIDVDTARDETKIVELMRRGRVERSVERLFPKVASQWDYVKNGNNRPWMFTPSSKLRAWWTCENGHSYQTRISHRCNGSGCPVCYQEKYTKDSNLQMRLALAD